MSEPMASSDSGPQSDKAPAENRRRWLDEPRNVNTVCYLLYGTCALLGLLDVLPFYHKHVEFAWEGWLNFFGFFGFASCVFLVLTAKQWRKVVKREEDYYDG
jgi:hypothetical protein